jgi:hypothetical protein
VTRSIVVALLALAGVAALAVTTLALADDGGVSGRNGIGVIEWAMRETPERHADAYLDAVAAGDREGALALWQMPERGSPEALALLGDRRRTVTADLAARMPRTHRVVGVEWWSTCCEPHPLRSERGANIARLTVELAGGERYVLDMRATEPDTLVDRLARRWILRDVYRATEEPLFHRWIASPNGIGSIYLGAPRAP